MLLAQENNYLYSVVELTGALDRRKPLSVLALLSSLKLRAEENRYIYSVFELTDAPGPRKQLYHIVFELTDAPGRRKR